jgi:hypothetical protein
MLENMKKDLEENIETPRNKDKRTKRKRRKGENAIKFKLIAEFSLLAAEAVLYPPSLRDELLP